MSQLGLDLRQPPAFTRSSFVVSPSNAEAATRVDAWPAWPGGALALVGPAGVGKSHLAAAWLARAEADRAAVLIEDADAALANGDLSDEALFHNINRAAAPGGALLLTARTLPRAWGVRLPDLRSRLNAMSTADIAPPDDAHLRALLDALFHQRVMTPAPDLIDYLAGRIERSAVAARQVVDQLNEAAHAGRRPITKLLARKVLHAAFGGEDGDPSGF